MSQKTTNLKQIEDLDVNQLAEALEFNGYAECVGRIRTKHIDGEAFLKLTELQLSLWRLPSIQARRLWSFIQQVQHDPKQFLMNTQTNKMAPKVNTSNKPSMNNAVINNNLSRTNSFSSNKPNVAVKPNQFQKSVQKSETKEPKSSTLTKQESTLFKNKLEQVFKKDSSETPNSSFIYNQKQPRLPPKPDHLRQIALADDKFEESPDDLNDGYLLPREVDPNQRKNEPEPPENERRPSVTFSRNTPTTGSFLHKFRKAYEHLEIRPQVIENKYEEQNVKPPKAIVQERPLPPIPVEINQNYAHDIEFETDDEELAEYTPVLDNENSNERKEKKFKEKGSKFHRPLPPVPAAEVSKSNQFLEVHQFNNDEELAEYTPVVEDDEELAEYTPVVEVNEIDNRGGSMQSRNNLLRRALSPLHIPAPSARFISANRSFKINERPKVLTPDSAEEELGENLQTMSLNRSKAKSKSPMNMLKSPSTPTKVLKPRANLPNSSASLPRPSANLPKPPSKLPMPPKALPKSPMDLPSSADFLTNSQDDLPNFGEHSNQIEGKPLPASPPMEIDELPFYSEIDVARENSYRETDRKGARRLLSGLEDGAFVIRPSRQPQYICTFSIMHSTKMFNLGIQRDSEGALGFGSVTPDFDQPKFYSVGEMVAYYSTHPLYLSGEFIILKDVLPRTRR